MSFAWTIVALVAVLAIAWRFLGSYMVAVFDGRARWWDRAARTSGVVVDAPRARVGSAIAAHAGEWGADAIVLSPRRRLALGVLLLGSVTDQFMREAACPVLVVRRERR